MTTEHRIDWPDHFIAILAERRAAFEARVKSLEDKLDVTLAERQARTNDRIQGIEDKLARTVANGTDGLRRAERDLRQAQEDAERRLNEKSSERDRNLEHESEVIDERFQAIYGFRDSINALRPTLITRDQLDSALKSVSDQVDILQRAITISAGRDTGMSRVGAWVVGAFAVLSAIGTMITALTVFVFHGR